jgi:hypothetical protein
LHSLRRMLLLLLYIVWHMQDACTLMRGKQAIIHSVLP